MREIIIKIALTVLFLSWINGGMIAAKENSGKIQDIGNSGYVLAEDSSNYINASILIISSINEISSVFGHVAFRMECPLHQLDYVFTFESDSETNGFLTLFGGKAKAAFIAVPTSQFITDIRNEGRGIRQYGLNLTHHEKQELWRFLDNDMVEGPHRNFNLTNHCVSMAIQKIQESCIDEQMEWAPWQGVMLLNNGDLVRQYVSKSSWAEFWFVTVLGNRYCEYADQTVRISPEQLPHELMRASFVGNDTPTKRPVITGHEQVLLEELQKPDKDIASPTMFFGVLLAVTCLITLAEWMWKRNGRRIAIGYDLALFICQTLAALVLLYIIIFSEVFGKCWNWYLIPFNLLPLLIWLCLHKQKNYGRVYLFYTVVLVVFLLMTPFVSQLDIPHQLLTANLAVRCGSNYMVYNKYSNNNYSTKNETNEL